MLTFITWKHGVETAQPHRLSDMSKAQVIFQHLLVVNSKVQLLLNGVVIKEGTNPGIPNEPLASSVVTGKKKN